MSTLVIDHRLVIESSLDGYLRVSKAGLVLDVNAAYCRKSGYSRDELVGMPVIELAAQPAAGKANTERIQHLGSYRFESSHRRKNGSLWDVEVSAVFGESNGGEMYGFLRDITDTKKLANALAEKDRHFAALVAATPVGVFETDASGGCIFVNQRWSDITGMTLHVAAGDGWARALHPQDRAIVAAEWAAAVAENRPFKLEYRFVGEDQKVVWVLGQSEKLVSATGETTGFIGAITDITSQKAMEDQVRQLAFQDALTHLPNRRLLLDRIKQALSASKRSGSFGALMFLDLDNFKTLNDAQGHDVGDLLLVDSAKRLTGCVREVDTVARFGGDEFVVLLSELETNLDEARLNAQTVAEKIRLSIGKPFHLTVQRDGQTDASIVHQCSTSIGVVMFSQTDTSPDDILKWADEAMYQAKKAGRNTVRFHST
jgi:diguanylate cyclase (GGDEF)-like protein/PAS domain S-box-containing protein